MHPAPLENDLYDLVGQGKIFAPAQHHKVREVFTQAGHPIGTFFRCIGRAMAMLVKTECCNFVTLEVLNHAACIQRVVARQAHGHV